MRIVVVGATGNIGTALLRAIAERSTVTLVDAVSRRGPGRLEWHGSGQLRHHHLDVAAPPDSADQRALRTLTQGADAIVHLAWSADRSASRASAANKAMTTAVLRAGRTAGQVVLLSCASVYSPSFGAVPRAEDWPTEGIADSPESQDKVGMELLAGRFAEAHPGVVLTVLRPALTLQESAGAVLVRRRLSRVVPGFALRGRLPVLLWPAGLTLQVAHAEDVAAAVLAAVERRAPGAYNVASPQLLGAEEVAAALGAARIVEVPRPLASGAHRAAWWTRLTRSHPAWLGATMAQPVLDLSRTETLLGVRPRWSAADVLTTAARGVAKRREGWTPALSREAEPEQRTG